MQNLFSSLWRVLPSTATSGFVPVVIDGRISLLKLNQYAMVYMYLVRFIRQHLGCFSMVVQMLLGSSDFCLMRSKTQKCDYWFTASLVSAFEGISTPLSIMARPSPFPSTLLKGLHVSAS